jgi:protein-tyrosine phosphatase
MPSILVVCTGNVCRSPLAEGFLRAALSERAGSDAPRVTSAGTTGWEGSAADPGSVEAAAERGVDISGHRARDLSIAELEAADLILGVSDEHARAVAAAVPEAAARTFTLKELVRLLDALPEPRPGDGVVARVSEAEALRRSGFEGDRLDRDVADPLGMPLDAFRAVARELETWCARLADGLLGRAEAPAAVASGEE